MMLVQYRFSYVNLNGEVTTFTTNDFINCFIGDPNTEQRKV